MANKAAASNNSNALTLVSRAVDKIREEETSEEISVPVSRVDQVIGHHHGGGGQQHRPAASGQRPAFMQREQKEIDKKEIQDKIRETQAKLAGSGGRGKSLKAKYRRAKRDEIAEHAAGEEMQDNKLQLTEFISVSELANLMDVSYAEVIGKCMSLGLMVSINQRLDAEGNRSLWQVNLDLMSNSSIWRNSSKWKSR